MEVHHHTHSARKRWTHYFWEFLMLFLAVFCGFLAEYQLEHYIEKQRAKDFALSLHRDLAADTSIFNTSIERLNTCIKKIDTLVGILDDPQQLRGNTTAVYYFSVYAFIYPSSAPNESTLQQLLNSGSLRYFKNNLLADSVKVYNKNIQLFKEFADASSDFNIEFRKNQLRVIDINPIIGFMEAGELFNSQTTPFNDLSFLKNRPLLTSEPSLLKEHANWCALKKFYFTNTVYRYNALKTQAFGVLKLLSKNYHIR